MMSGDIQNMLSKRSRLKLIIDSKGMNRYTTLSLKSFIKEDVFVAYCHRKRFRHFSDGQNIQPL